MNIEAYDADSLRKMVRLLEYENKILKDKLKKAGISYEEVNPFEEKIESAEEYDLDQGNRIVNPPYITEKMAIRFFSMFWGREDVYARRGKNGGYFPQCANRWNDRLCPKQRKEKVFCDECENTKCYELIRAMQLVGINVITRTEVEECFAVIDDEIVWHGGMNLLGKADVWDNLMRIRNPQVATELLEIALEYSEARRKSE